jgi:TadE-like protein
MKDEAAQRQKRALGRPPFEATQQSKSAEAGQSLLELAVMLPFLLLLVLGVVEIGRAAFINIAVANGAYAGVEYGAQNPGTAGDTAGMIQAAKNDLNLSGSGIVKGITVTPVATQGCRCDAGAGTSCATPLPPASSCATIACGSGQVVECVQVVTSATFSPLFHYPGLPDSFTAHGNAVMRVRR